MRSCFFIFQKISPNLIVSPDCAVFVPGEDDVPPLEADGPVDEVEIQVVEAQVRKGLLAGGFHVVRVVAVVPQLARDEQLLPESSHDTLRIQGLWFG